MNLSHLTLLIMVLGFSICCVINPDLEDRIPDVASTAPSPPNIDWLDLAKNSSFICTGRVDDILYVVDEKKMFEDKVVKNGIVPLPNLKDGVKGLLVRFTVGDVLYAKNGKIPKRAFEIYVENGYQVSTDSQIPRFMVGKRYLVSIGQVEKKDEYADRIVLKPQDYLKGRSRFAPENSFKVIRDASGYFEINESTLTLIDQARQSLKNL